MIDRKTAPNVSEFGRLSIPIPEKVTSPSGTELFFLKKGSESVCSLTVLFPFGDIQASSPEMMRILTSSWREGSKSYSAEQIADALDYYGAWMNISSSMKYTQLSLFGLTSNICKILPVLTDLILNPLFDEEPVNSIRERLISTHRINMDKAKNVVRRMIKKQLLGEAHPFAREITEEGFRKVQPLDVVELHKKIISCKPVLFLSGNLTDEVVKTILNFAEAITPASPEVPEVKIEQGTPAPDRLCRHLMADKTQSAISIGIPAVDRAHPDYDQLRITVMLLGGYFGSRLMSNIREEKGYTYGISASLVGYNELGYIQIECECDNSYVDAVVEEIKNECVKLTTTPVSEEELNTVRKYIKSTLAALLNDPFETMGYYVSRKTVGYPDDYFYSQQRALETITPERIMELSKLYLNPENMYISIAGGEKVPTV